MSAVIVFGASGALGKSVCRLAADLGHRVIPVSRTDTGADPVTSNVLMDEQLTTSLLSTVLTLEAAPTRLIGVVTSGANNYPHTVGDSTGLELIESVRENVVSVLTAINALHAIPVRPISVVAIGSIFSVQGGSSNTPYTTAKHALVGLVRAATEDYRQDNIAINALCPGPIIGEMLRDVLKRRNPGKDADHLIARLQESRGPKSILEYDEVAAAALHLASMGFVGVRGQIVVQDN